MTCYCKECSWVGEPIDNSIEGHTVPHLQCRNCGSLKLELYKVPVGTRRSAIMSKEMLDANEQR